MQCLVPFGGQRVSLVPAGGQHGRFEAAESLAGFRPMQTEVRRSQLPA